MYIHTLHLADYQIAKGMQTNLGVSPSLYLQCCAAIVVA